MSPSFFFGCLACTRCLAVRSLGSRSEAVWGERKRLGGWVGASQKAVAPCPLVPQGPRLHHHRSFRLFSSRNARKRAKLVYLFPPLSRNFLKSVFESTKRVLMHSFTIDRRCHEWPCWNPSPSNRRGEKGEGRADMGHPLTKSEAWGGELRRGRRPGGEKAKRGYSHESEPGLPVPLRRKQKNERRRRHRPYTRAPRSPHARARYRPLTRSSPGFRACPE